MIGRTQSQSQSAEVFWRFDSATGTTLQSSSTILSAGRLGLFTGVKLSLDGGVAPHYWRRELLYEKLRGSQTDRGGTAGKHGHFLFSLLISNQTLLCSSLTEGNY